MMKNIYEIFDEFEAAQTKEEKIEVLRKNNSYALTNVLRGTFDSSIEFVIDKVPYYKPSDSPPGLAYTSIHQELSRAYLFEKNNPRVPPNLSEKRREELLIGLLESLEKREAEVFMNMLLKKQTVRGLNKKIINEAFPNLLP
jgi:hypothetical protein